VAPDVRDTIVDWIRSWSARSEVAVKQLLRWLGLAEGKYYAWCQRYGQVNEHNSWIPRDHWLEEWEKDAIVQYWHAHPLDGYRRLTFMMLDDDVVAVSPASVYRVLAQGGLLRRWNRTPSRKGTGFEGPSRPHEHWHIDMAYLNICGTFYYLCSILDGFSRAIVHHEIRTSMTECDVEVIVQRAREQYPAARPRLISDNGPPFIAKDFKAFIRLAGMTHVRTSPYYPQSNGKLERYHRTVKHEAVRRQTPLDLADARRVVADFVAYYNTVRLHSAIGYVPPQAKLEGRDQQILAVRDQRLAAARERRRQRRTKGSYQSTRMAG
jgi:putative transposase